jgi:hypothetical protein
MFLKASRRAGVSHSRPQHSAVFRRITGFIAPAILGLGLLGSAAPAHALLVAAGPIDPVTQLPTFFMDQANQQLSLCDIINPNIVGGGEANGPPCPGLALIDPSPTGPGVVASNIEEAVFYSAEGDLQPATGERYVLALVIEAGEGGVLNEARIRLRRLTLAGTYIVDTPYGQTSINVTDPTNDVDTTFPGFTVGSPPDFANTLNGNISCFWSNGTGGNVVVPNRTFIGDGTTLAPLTPTAPCPQTTADLIFRVTAPDGSVIETNQFIVQGMLFAGTGVIPTRTTYERNADGSVARLDNFVRSTPAATITVNGTGLPNNRIMVEDPLNPGYYYLRERFTVATTVIPATINVQGLTVNLVDEVNIGLARYNVNNDQLTINADSSDLNDVPVLTAFDQAGRQIGVLAAGTLTATLVVPPSSVTVRSSHGGSATLIVDAIGGNQIGN